MMVLSGSFLFVGYLAWEKLFRKKITQGMRYRALKVVLFVCLIPWGWLWDMYNHIGFPTRNEKIAVSMSLLFMMLWLVIAFLLVIARTAKCLKEIYALRFLAVECGDRNLEEVSDRLQNEKLYGRRVRIAWTRGENDTMTIGILRPVILLQKKYDEGNLYWILKHEVIHVDRQDLLAKWMMEIACCLHWLNPLIYVMNRQFAFVSETSCDERVVRGCTEEERRLYAELLDKSRKESCLRAPVGCSLKRFNRDIDRRIELIVEGDRTERKQKVVATVIFTLLVLMEAVMLLFKCRHLSTVFPLQIFRLVL